MLVEFPVNKVKSFLSGTTIRGTQIKVENHPAPRLREKSTKETYGLNSPLLGLQQDV
jgi:hypothetical protein